MMKKITTGIVAHVDAGKTTLKPCCIGQEISGIWEEWTMGMHF